MLTICNILEEWSFDHTDDFFADVILDSRLSKELLADRIRECCGNLICVYSERNTLKHYSDNFFKRNEKRFKDLTDTLYYEYNPIENYDRREDSKLTHDGHSSASSDSNGSTSRSAFNSAANHPVDASSGHAEGENFDDFTDTNEARIHGNIGVTTTQQMIESQRNVVMFDIIDRIVALWEVEFCLLIF